MVIREAVIKDVPSIKELIGQLGYVIKESDLEKNIDNYNRVKGHVLVAEEKESIIGFIAGAYIPLFHAQGLLFRISAMCVDQSKRSKGIGRQLINVIEERSRENNCFYIEVTSGAHRKDEAHLFYINLGYTIYEGKRFLKTLEQ